MEREEEILSYFDPEIVQPAYKLLLRKSRNIVVGPPKEILREYFGYGKDDPIPIELRNDDTPKAFILPKHMWKAYDDIEAQKEQQEKKKQKQQQQQQPSQSSLSLANTSTTERPSTEPTPKPSKSRSILERTQKKKDKEEDVLDSASRQQRLLDPQKNPLNFFKQPGLKTHSKIDHSVPGGDPLSYERVRTKCERKKRRETSFDEDVRKRESEYEVICGSGSSSDTGIIGKSLASLATSKPRVSTAASSRSSRTQPPSIKMDPNMDRVGSSISIEPDPMTRLPREDSELKFYPTFSNEPYYDWYKELNRLQDPLSRQLRRSKSIGGINIDDDERDPYTGKTRRVPRSILTGTPRSFLSRHEKPERADYDTKDYLYDNARSITIMPPRNPIPRYVDDRNGTTHLLEPSGLLHKYVHRDDFGKVPSYLMFRNEELGRPPLPNFNKFYKFHRCKYVHGHIHAKCCNRVYPTRGGCGDWLCEEVLREDDFGDYAGGVKVNASHSHSRLEDSLSQRHRDSSQLSKEMNDVDPVVQYVVSRISKLLTNESTPNYCTSTSAANYDPSSTTNYCSTTAANYDPSSTTNYCSTSAANFDPSSTTNYCSSTAANNDPSSTTNYCSTSAANFDPSSTTNNYCSTSAANYDPSSTTNYCPSGTTGHPSASNAGQNFYGVATRPNILSNLESSSTGAFTSPSIIPVPYRTL